MADVDFAVGFAVGLQTDIDTVNASIAALSGTVDETEGAVLGDRESGDFESGITLPNFVRENRGVADVAGSFTKQPSSFLRVGTEGLEISWQVKGNGNTMTTPVVGEAKPDAGIDALHEMAGLVGANGSAPVYEYKPRVVATSGGITKYGTIKIWVADLEWVLEACTLSSLKFTVQPGGIVLATAAIQVGAVNAFSDGITFPTFDYGNQATLQSNTVENVTTGWGPTRGWETLEMEVANTLGTEQDSSKEGGVRTVQSSRRLRATGRIYVDSSDSDFEYQELIKTAAPTADLAFQLGTPAGAGPDIANAILFQVSNLEVLDYKAQPVGTVFVVEFESEGTHTGAGLEALFTYN